jgi:hypothetical protein
MGDTVFEESVSDKSFIETSNFLRSNGIRHDKQNKERISIHIHNSYKSPGTVTTKKDKIKNVLIN